MKAAYKSYTSVPSHNNSSTIINLPKSGWRLFVNSAEFSKQNPKTSSAKADLLLQQLGSCREDVSLPAADNVPPLQIYKSDANQHVIEIPGVLVADSHLKVQNAGAELKDSQSERSKLLPELVLFFSQSQATTTCQAADSCWDRKALRAMWRQGGLSFLRPYLPHPGNWGPGEAVLAKLWWSWSVALHPPQKP